ncbi:unnamed protein product, partial [marine sediment metagenome]
YKNNNENANEINVKIENNKIESKNIGEHILNNENSENNNEAANIENKNHILNNNTKNNDENANEINNENNNEDLNRIFSIAILQDFNSEIFKQIWDINNPEEILKILQENYNALFTERRRLHNIVQQFLFNYILENEILRTNIGEKIAELALSFYEKKYKEECEAEPERDIRFRNNQWKKSAQNLLIALAWTKSRNAVDFFLKLGLELFLFNLSFIYSLKKILDPFLSFDNKNNNKTQKKAYKQINTLIKTANNFNWYNIWAGMDKDADKERLNQILEFCTNA